MTLGEEHMLYNKYTAWLKGLSPTGSVPPEVANYKPYLNQLYRDDTVRKMVGLKLLEDNVIDKGLFDIMLLNNIKNYL